MTARKPPFETAQDIFHSRYPGAALVFAAGSFNRGEDTAFSDLDLVVVFPRLERAYRESYYFGGWPVEAFVHDPETLHYFMTELDGKEGVPALPCMVLEGRSWPADHEWSSKLKSLADRVLKQGPPAWSDDEIRNQRYVITDLIDDIRAPRSLFEARAVLGALHETLGQFYFRARGSWAASRKHLPRRLEKTNPELHMAWRTAFDEAYEGRCEKIIRLAEQITAPYGGLIFEGYVREAPVSWRRELPAVALSKGTLVDLSLTPEESRLDHPELGLLRLRPVREKDVSALRVLLNRAYRRLADMGLNYSATFQDEELTHNGLYEGGSVLVIERGEDIVATMKVQNFNAVDEARCLYISRFAVSPDLQKSGLGTHLLGLAEKIARREGCVCLQLDTAQPARHLVDYYRSQGFRILRPIYYEGKTYTSWILQKDLQT